MILTLFFSVNQIRGQPFYIYTYFELCDSENEKNIYQWFKEGQDQYPFPIIKASSAQESKNSGCNIYMTGKTLGTNIVASVASVYLNKILLLYRMIGNDHVHVKKKIGAFITYV